MRTLAIIAAIGLAAVVTTNADAVGAGMSKNARVHHAPHCGRRVACGRSCIPKGRVCHRVSADAAKSSSIVHAVYH